MIDEYDIDPEPETREDLQAGLFLNTAEGTLEIYDKDTNGLRCDLCSGEVVIFNSDSSE